jgi:thiol-disulfide isomerase/thioredoxin
MLMTVSTLLAASGQVAPPASAQEMLAQATAQAASEHKQVMVVFGASWCGYCRLTDAFFTDRKIQPVIARYFVIVHFAVQEEKHPELNTPGAEKVYARLMGDAAGAVGGLPTFLILSGKGELLVSSLRPTEKDKIGENIGYPVAPEEIDWFMTMMHKSVPDLSAEEAGAMESYLKARAATLKHAH